MIVRMAETFLGEIIPPPVSFWILKTRTTESRLHEVLTGSNGIFQQRIHKQAAAGDYLPGVKVTPRSGRIDTRVHPSSGMRVRLPHGPGKQ